MDIWKSDKWRMFYADKTYRSGIRMIYDKDVNPEVKRAINNMLSWLRNNFVFPVRLRVYVKKDLRIKSSDGDMVPDLFFWPYNRLDEPYIKLATGDYQHLLKRLGKDDALATILSALLRELTHYFQWLNDIRLTLLGEQRQATWYARMRLDEYSETRECP